METTFETLYDSIAETLVTTDMPAKPERSAEIPENFYMAGMHSPACIAHWLREGTCICPKTNR